MVNPDEEVYEVTFTSAASLTLVMTLSDIASVTGGLTERLHAALTEKEELADGVDASKLRDHLKAEGFGDFAERLRYRRVHSAPEV